VNDYSGGGTAFSGVQYWIFNKSQLVSGASSVNSTTFGPDPTMVSLHPAQHLTTTAVFYMITNCLGACVSSFFRFPTSSARLVSVSGVPPGVVSITSNTFAINTNTMPPNAQQPGTSTLLTTNDYRVLSAAWENNNLWFSATDACTPNGDSATRSCARLIQITTNGTSPPTKIQDFDYASSGQYFFYPAVSLFQGQLVVVYGISNSSIYPSLLVTGRAPTDPANTLQAPFTIRSGSAPDTSGRYGDYFGAATDPTPSANSTFWVAGEYRKSSVFESWNTSIARVAALGALSSGAPNITSFAPPPPVNDTTGASRAFNITVNQTVNVTW
jgi:hypothetical protein